MEQLLMVSRTRTSGGMWTSPTREIEKAQNELTQTWRQILVEENITSSNFDRMLGIYVRKYYGNDKNASRISAKGNIKKMATEPAITWRTFKILLAITDPAAVSFTTKYHNRKGHIREFVAYFDREDQEEVAHMSNTFMNND